jgi:hypothetical protein
MKKKGFLLVMLAMVLAFGLILVGCDTFNNKDDISNDAVIVKINLPVSSMRSVSTEGLISQTTGYTLVVTKSGTDVYTNSFPVSQTVIQVELTTGSHTFTLNAMNNDIILGTGSTTIELVKGNNTVNIVLIPVQTDPQENAEKANAIISASWQDNENAIDTSIDDYYGIWKNANNVTRTITAKDITAISDSFSYTITINSWVEAINTFDTTKTDYPYGYTMSGTVTAMNRGNLSSDVNNGGVPDAGQPYSTTYYLHINKQSFSSAGKDEAAIFTKQLY